MCASMGSPSHALLAKLKDQFAQSRAAVALARERAERANARAEALRLLVLTRSALEATDRDRVRKAWTGAVDEVARTTQARDRAFAVLSHELRQALSAALAALRLSNVALQPDTVEKARSVLERQLLHLSRLVEDTLEFSRLELEPDAIRREPCELGAVIAAAVDAVRPEAEERTQTLTAERPDRPIWLIGDGTRLQQVFSNLLGNAIRFTPANGSIRLTATADDGIATVAVQDTGRGILADELNTIFQPFTRGAAGSSGLGIGLALVQRIVALHGGQITVESAGESLGSRFTVTLPCRSTA
jgi:signal transduction histidine kinase